MEYSWKWKDGSAISGASASVKGLYGQKYDLPVVSARKVTTKECTTEYAVNVWNKDKNAKSGTGIEGRFGEENETFYAVNSIKSTAVSDPAGTDESAKKKSDPETEKNTEKRSQENSGDGENGKRSEEAEKKDPGKDVADAEKKESEKPAADESKAEPEKTAADTEKKESEKTADESSENKNDTAAEKAAAEDAKTPEVTKSPEEPPKQAPAENLVKEEKEEASESKTDPAKEAKDPEEGSEDEKAG
jgi:hypothetical protein